MYRILLLAATLVPFLAGTLSAQQPARISTPLSGPRVGMTIVTGSLAERLEDEFGMQLAFTQFGWQFEGQMFQAENGLSALTEFVVLVGGLEQGRFLPSLNALVGLRGPSGVEIAVGPNVSASGVGLAVAAGVSLGYGGINIPINLAAVPSGEGVRMSMLTGFTLGK